MVRARAGGEGPEAQSEVRTDFAKTHELALGTELGEKGAAAATSMHSTLI